jgi:hypothetical protein
MRGTPRDYRWLRTVVSWTPPRQRGRIVTFPMPPIVVLAAAVVVGLLFKGSLRNFERVRIHWWALAIGGLLLQIVPIPSFPDIRVSDGTAGALLLSYGLLLGFLAVNRWVPAAALMAVGLLMNIAVVGANGGMPVSANAIIRAGGSEQALIAAQDSKHHLMTDDDVLRPLADVIPIPPPGRVVLSIGDVLLYSGMAWFVVQVMLGRSRENPRPMAMWFPAYRGKHAPAHWRLPARNRTAGHAAAGRSGSGP